MKLQLEQVVERVGIVLSDLDHIRWPLPEKTRWAFDAQLEIAQFKPEAVAKIASIPLAAGARQNLPDDGVALLDVLGNTGGSAVRIVSRELLDASTPGWQQGKGSNSVRHVIFDLTNPTSFYVYPPSDGRAALDLVYAAIPDSGFLLDQTWLAPVVNYVLYRAYGKDAEYAGNGELAAAYYQAFLAAVQGKTQAELGANPNLANEARNGAVHQTLSR